MKAILESIFCKHEYYTNSNIHGDMIIVCNWHRTVVKCKKCGKYKSIPEFREIGIRV